MTAQENKEGGLSWAQPPSNKPDDQKNSAAKVPAAPPKNPQPSLMATNQNTPTTMPVIVASLVVGIIAGVLVGWLWFINPRANESGVATSGATTIQEEDGTQAVPNAPSVSQPAQTGITTSGSGIVVSAQPAGSFVAISSVSVAAPTWLVVYESRNGAPGNALGAKLFAPQEHGGAVYLLRNTVAGQTYFVGQRTDNGNRVFSLESDTPVTDASGKIIVTQFQAQ